MTSFQQIGSIFVFSHICIMLCTQNDVNVTHLVDDHVTTRKICKKKRQQLEGVHVVHALDSCASVPIIFHESWFIRLYK